MNLFGSAQAAEALPSSSTWTSAATASALVFEAEPPEPTLVASTIETTTDPQAAMSKLNLTDWQISQLGGLSRQGIECLLRNWVLEAKHPIEEPHCNATWDEIHCWPHALAGQTVRAPCFEVMRDDPNIADPSGIKGDAYRICSEDATWLWGNWTNYNVCMAGIDLQQDQTELVRTATRYTLFLGSILSLLSLCAALYIFYKFRSLRCDRVLIHIQLMLALAVRFFLLIIMTEPFIFQRETNYRSVDWLCKLLLALQFVAQVASVNWMFVQGHYLHSRLTSSVFDGRVPLIPYCLFGWGLPFILVSTWAGVMETFHPKPCWHKYGHLWYNWILLGPMLFVLFVNCLFLINIIRILCSKMQVTNGVAAEPDQFRRLAKATIVLFPLLGINNLLFFYNPGGTAELYYILTNAVLQSSQGIFVAFFYCFLSNDVKDTLKREYSRFWAQRRPSRGNSLRTTMSEDQSRRMSCKDMLPKWVRRSPTNTATSRLSLPKKASGDPSKYKSDFDRTTADNTLLNSRPPLCKQRAREESDQDEEFPLSAGVVSCENGSSRRSNGSGGEIGVMQQPRANFVAAATTADDDVFAEDKKFIAFNHPVHIDEHHSLQAEAEKRLQLCELSDRLQLEGFVRPEESTQSSDNGSELGLCSVSKCRQDYPEAGKMKKKKKECLELQSPLLPGDTFV